MRKLLLVCIGAIGLSTSNVSAQAVEEGNVIIDLYYGFPNLYNTVFTALVSTGSEDNLNAGGIGPLGLRAEYMLADKVGLGVDVAYSNAHVSYDYNTTNAQGAPVTYQDKYSTMKIGAMVTFNYHFLDHDALDFYGTMGAGYKNRSFKYTSTDPSFVEDSYDFGTNPIPIAFRVGVGMRYFFTDNIGMNVAVGLGQGGILNGGLSFKF
jgi:opacity protein-like surface antigen